MNYYSTLGIDVIDTYDQFEEVIAQLQAKHYKNINKGRSEEARDKAKQLWNCAVEFNEKISSQEDLETYNKSLDNDNNLEKVTQQILQMTLQTPQELEFVNDFKIELNSKNYLVAINIAQRLTEINNDSMMYWNMLAVANQYAGYIEQAGYAYRKALDKPVHYDIENLYEDYAWYMYCNDVAGNPSIKAMYDTYPNNRKLKNMYAGAISKNSQFEEAMQLLIELYEENPEDQIKNNISSLSIEIMNYYFNRNNDGMYIYTSEESIVNALTILNRSYKYNPKPETQRFIDSAKAQMTEKIFIKRPHLQAAIYLLAALNIYVMFLAFEISYGIYAIMIVAVNILILWLLFKLHGCLSMVLYKYNLRCQTGQKDIIDHLNSVFKFVLWILLFFVMVILWFIGNLGSSRD